jgi:hypothetical protein
MSGMISAALNKKQVKFLAAEAKGFPVPSVG